VLWLDVVDGYKRACDIRCTNQEYPMPLPHVPQAALAFLLVSVAVAAPAQTRQAQLPDAGAPVVATVRTFTTSAGAHYFNGKQMVTCRTRRDCAVQAFVAKDVVPLAIDATRLLVIDNPTTLRTCRLDLTDCQPIFAASFPGAKVLTASGQVRLQPGPYLCGYTPTAGTNCSVRWQAQTPETNAAKAFVGEANATTAQNNITVYCGTCGHPVSISDVASRMSLTMDYSGRGAFGEGPGLGEAPFVYDDSAAYGEWEQTIGNYQYTQKGRQQCYAVCSHNRTVENNDCARTSAEIVTAAPVVGAAVGMWVAVEGGGPAGWSAFKETSYIIGIGAGVYGSACAGLAASRENRCIIHCDISNGPGD
jgi:hypothetical protein